MLFNAGSVQPENKSLTPNVPRWDNWEGKGQSCTGPPVVPHGCWRGGAKDAGRKVLWVTPNGCWGASAIPKAHPGEGGGNGENRRTTTHKHPITTHSFPTALPWALTSHGLSATYRGCPTYLQSTHGCWGGSEGVRGWVSPLGTTCPQAFPHSRFVPSVGSLKIWASSSHLASRAQGAMNAVGSGRICGLSVLLL